MRVRERASPGRRRAGRRPRRGRQAERRPTRDRHPRAAAAPRRHLRAARVSGARSRTRTWRPSIPRTRGLLAQGRPRFVPSTPASCFYLLDAYARSTGREPESFYPGSTLVVVGRSDSVGKPAASLGLQRHATVVTCHSRTRDLAAFTQQADILIVAAGVAGPGDRRHGPRRRDRRGRRDRSGEGPRDRARSGSSGTSTSRASRRRPRRSRPSPVGWGRSRTCG